MRRITVPAALLSAAVAFSVAAQDAAATTYTVTTANSVGAGSLREQIINANNDIVAGVVDDIAFDIPGNGRHQITPSALDLPAITDPLLIDGYTQPGSVPAAAAGVPAVIKIVINATNTTRGLEVATDDSTIRGLAVHSAGVTAAGAPAADGIRLYGDGNRVEGSHLGVRATGGAAGNVSDGVEIAGDGNVVGGKAPEDRNVISDNGFAGVALSGEDNRVKGNTIGTDPDVSADLGNDVGVWIAGDDNTVGGSALEGAGNLISGNETGVQVEIGIDNEVSGNLIGTEATGNAALDPNFFTGLVGVKVESTASATVIGRATEGTGNVISGEGDEGIYLAGDDNLVQGNMIGTNADGDTAIEGLNGIFVTGDDNTIGGTLSGEENVISGHIGEGIHFRADVATNDPAEGNHVEGNLIGTDAGGALAIPNGSEGIELVDANDNWIGGTAQDAGNVIAANGSDGVKIRIDDTGGADGNHVLGNTIGTNASGADLGNGGAGVRIEGGDHNHVGRGDVTVPMNTIAFNDADGVAVEGGAANAVVRNAIFDNGELGIDLENDDVTLNDPPLALDGDTGANGLQNFPLVDLASNGAGGTTVNWRLDSLPLTEFRIDFYANDTCDPSGHGEGQEFLDSVVVTTDAAGHADGSTPTATAAAVGRQVTATASVRNPPGVDASSEFSPCRTVLFGGPIDIDPIDPSR